MLGKKRLKKANRVANNEVRIRLNDDDFKALNDYCEANDYSRSHAIGRLLRSAISKEDHLMMLVKSPEFAQIITAVALKNGGMGGVLRAAFGGDPDTLNGFQTDLIDQLRVAGADTGTA